MRDSEPSQVQKGVFDRLSYSDHESATQKKGMRTQKRHFADALKDNSITLDHSSHVMWLYWSQARRCPTAKAGKPVRHPPQ
jgi:hypothetical protein